jgi:hypothetical protein
MKAKFINEKLTGFTEDSDAIKDMGIGLKPEQVLENFQQIFDDEFDQVVWYNEAGSDYDLPEKDVVRVGEESFSDEDHPIFKLFCGKYHELDFAMNNKAANSIVPGATWGWIYYVEGKAHHLKDAYDFDDVVKQVCKIAGVTKTVITKRIKKYDGYTSFLKKLDNYTV